jgi:hypothetical protein
VTRPARWIAAACALIGLLALSPTAPPAQASTASLDVVIDRLTPLVPQPGGLLRIGGRLVSTAPSTLSSVLVRLHLSSVVLSGSEQIDAAMDAGIDRPWDESDDYILDWTKVEVTDSLDPGQQESFAFEVSLDDLPFAGPGVYVLAVEALTAGPQGSTRAGLARTFLPWFPDSSVERIGLTWIWPLADHPARMANGVLLDDRTPVALSPGGRLHQLAVIGGERARLLTWVVDPSLLQTAASISDGYFVEHQGKVVAGDRAQQAAQWMDLVRRSIVPGSVHAMSYADIDAVAVQRADMPNDVVRAVTGASGVASDSLGVPVPGGFSWPSGAQLDRPTANLLASAGNSVVVLASSTSSSTASPHPNGVASMGTPSGTMVAIVANHRLVATLGMPQRNASEMLLARQRFLAETGLVAQQATGPVILAVAPQDIRWSPAKRFIAPLLRATQEAPWLRPAPLTELLGAPRSILLRQPVDVSAELPSTYLQRVRRAQVRMTRVASVLQDPGPITGPFSAALLRAQSSAWRDDLPTGERLVQSINEGLAEQGALVRVLSSGTITFSGDIGKVPVTVANDTDQTVTVGLALLSTPTTRLSADPIQDIVIESGRKVSLDVTARVVGSDPLPVRVQLLTPEGERYGSPASITLISAAYARAASWVVIAAFIALGIFVVIGVVQRIRRTRAKRPVQA